MRERARETRERERRERETRERGERERGTDLFGEENVLGGGRRDGRQRAHLADVRGHVFRGTQAAVAAGGQLRLQPRQGVDGFLRDVQFVGGLHHFLRGHDGRRRQVHRHRRRHRRHRDDAVVLAAGLHVRRGLLAQRGRGLRAKPRFRDDPSPWGVAAVVTGVGHAFPVVPVVLLPRPFQLGQVLVHERVFFFFRGGRRRYVVLDVLVRDFGGFVPRFVRHLDDLWLAHADPFAVVGVGDVVRAPFVRWRRQFGGDRGAVVPAWGHRCPRCFRCRCCRRCRLPFLCRRRRCPLGADGQRSSSSSSCCFF